MNRCLAFVFALLLTSISVASACTAAPADWVQFKLESEGGGNGIKASFRDEARPNHENNWSTALSPAELVGLDVSGFRSVGTRPLRFAIVREAGRLDCAGQGGSGYASGNCSMMMDPGFARLLESRGIGQPTRDQAWALIALNVRRSLIDAIAAARYPTPTIEQLVEMTAVGVNANYIAGLAREGYRPNAIHNLVEFRALNISPEYIGGLARVGYSNIPAEDLVQLKALNVSPEFITGFERLGYAHLPVSTLVQLKALDITPEFVRSTGVQRGSDLSVDELVQRKIFGRRR